MLSKKYDIIITKTKVSVSARDFKLSPKKENKQKNKKTNIDYKNIIKWENKGQ